MNDDASEIVRLLREIRDLLAGQEQASSVTGGRRPKRPAIVRARKPDHQNEPQVDSRVVEKLMVSKADMPKWEPVWEHGKPLDKWLACLLVAEQLDGAPVALTAADIARLVGERFRVAGVHAGNVNRDLRNARNYVNRRRGVRGFEHTLNRKGITYAETRREELANRKSDAR